jgi:SAM-dependent methyltransferase
VLQWLHRAKPALSLIGIDPSKNMLDLAKRSVPHEASLQVARGDELPLPDNAVDLAVATGIMHHVDNPAAVITEMSRVARKALLISDHNNYAFGGSLEKRIRVALKLCGLFGVATFIKQGFNRQGYSAEDGWWYPYSLFDNYADVARFSTEIYIFPTRPPGAGGWANMLFIQGHFAILAIRRDHRPNPALT